MDCIWRCSCCSPALAGWIWCSVCVSCTTCIVLMPVSPSLQVNGKPVRKEESKTAAPGGGNEKNAAKSSSTSKPTPGNSEELQTLNCSSFCLIKTPHHISWFAGFLLILGNLWIYPNYTFQDLINLWRKLWVKGNVWSEDKFHTWYISCIK